MRIFPSSVGSESSVLYSVCSGVFIVKQVEVTDKASGAPTMVNIRILVEAFLNLYMRTACFIDEALLS